MGIETILGMIPKGGRYAKSVVNFNHKAPKSWPEFKAAIQQIIDLLKIKRLRLDGKQKTIFETNKNILKNHEKVTKKVDVPPSSKKEFPPFNVSKTDPSKAGRQLWWNVHKHETFIKIYLLLKRNIPRRWKPLTRN